MNVKIEIKNSRGTFFSVNYDDVRQVSHRRIEESKWGLYFNLSDEIKLVKTFRSQIPLQSYLNVLSLRSREVTLPYLLGYPICSSKSAIQKIGPLGYKFNYIKTAMLMAKTKNEEFDVDEFKSIINETQTISQKAYLLGWALEVPHNAIALGLNPKSFYETLLSRSLDTTLQ
ncbi:MAG: hypothetical protein ACRDBG_02590 [Waterburya sp.]